NGEFISAFKYVDTVTWTSGLDRKGVPQNRREPTTETNTVFCPTTWGGRSWNQATFNVKTGLLYNMGTEWCTEARARKQELVPGKVRLGGTERIVPPPSGKVTAHLDAFD